MRSVASVFSVFQIRKIFTYFPVFETWPPIARNTLKTVANRRENSEVIEIRKLNSNLPYLE